MRSQSRLVQDKFVSSRMLFLCPLLLAVLLSVLQTLSASEEAVADPLELRVAQKHHISLLPDLLAENSGDHTDDDIQFEDRVVVVTFFASWCPPCLDEFKALNVISSEFGPDNITVVALNVFEEFDDNDEARMQAFLQNTQPEFTVLKGNKDTRELFGGIKRIPTLLVFDRSGRQAFNFVHQRGAEKQSVDASELLDAIRPLI